MRHANTLASLLAFLCLLSPAGAEEAPPQFLDAATLAQLETAGTPFGASIRRWHDPALDPRNYHAVIVEPVRYHPADPLPTARVGRSVLAQLPRDMTSALREAVGRQIKVTGKAAPGTLRLRSAIVAVAAEHQNIKLRELLPVAMIFAAYKLSTGTRAQEAVVEFEWELRDAQTDHLLAAGIRKGVGGEIEDTGKPVTMKSLRPAIDQWADDASAAFAPFRKER